jgi:epoxyqueuosine reductase
MPQRPQQPAHQCRLARAQIALEVERQAGFQFPRQLRAECQRRGFVGQMAAATHGIIDCMHEQDLSRLAQKIKQWGRELGFAAVGIADGDLGAAEAGLQEWLDRGFHGEMDYMARTAPSAAGRPNWCPAPSASSARGSIIFRPASADPHAVLNDADAAYVSRYALGRDYHKVLRNRLQSLAEKISAEIGEHHFRVFTDSAPVLEVELAANPASAGAANTRCC